MIFTMILVSTKSSLIAISVADFIISLASRHRGDDRHLVQPLHASSQ